MEFQLRDIDEGFWREIRAKQITDGHASIKLVIFGLLAGWLKGKYKLAPATDKGGK